MAATPMVHGRRPMLAARFLAARWPGNWRSDAQAVRPLSHVLKGRCREACCVAWTCRINSGPS
eukprot:9776300-Lingulodinium_polyedra.AAC.1